MVYFNIDDPQQKKSYMLENTERKKSICKGKKELRNQLITIGSNSYPKKTNRKHTLHVFPDATETK